MAETNVEGTNDNSGTASGSLFQGKQFWLSKNIPQRSRFKEAIEQNGGVIRLFEKDADVKLVDHARKSNLPADAFSYRFVEESVRKGRLENLEKYRVGPSASRPVGATNIPSRGHKVLYTLQDDQELWDWMQSYEEDPNAPIRGNRIYQELAIVNPRHTYQSYRDRYLKKLRGRPRPGGMPPSTAPSATQGNNQRAQNPTPTATAAAAVASSPRQRSSQGPGTVTQAPEFRKRKRTPSPDSLDDTDSDGGDIPPQKRRATRSPGSGAKAPTPEIPQQSEGTQTRPEPPPSSQIIIPTFEDSITERRKTEKGKAPEKAAEKAPEKVPEKEPAREQEKIPEELPQQIPDQNSRPPSPVDKDNEPEPIDEIFLELPFLPSSPGSSEPEEQPEQDIDAWIDNRLRTGLAKTEDQVIEALRCTSMDPQLADRVLKHLVAGEGIPKDMAGVWTAEDDRCMEGRDTRDIERVLEKHGSEFFNSRWQYLDMARTAGLEKGQEGIAEL